MKLITEINDDLVSFITEGTGTNKSYFIEGVFLQGNLKNKNNRIYPVDVLKREVSRYVTEFVDQSRAYGELSHPASPQINLERVSHMIKELRQDGNDFIGRAKIMDTPYGKIAKNFIDEGAKLAVSSRGLGSLTEKNGASEVGDDFRLSTAADLVADPSAPDAFVRGIMESREWIFESGILKSYEIEKMQKAVSNASSRKLDEIKIKVFEEFIRKL